MSDEIGPIATVFPKEARVDGMTPTHEELLCAARKTLGEVIRLREAGVGGDEPRMDEIAFGLAIAALERQPALTTALRAAREALRSVIDYQGIDHDDASCPEDSTCECLTISQVNTALATIDEVLK